LSQNYPNPFNPTTNIRFELARTERVSLKIYNIMGQEITTLVEGTLMAGSYQVPFDAADLASGVYFYRLSSPNRSETRKMVLLK
jgi:peptide deformylase